jgi:hypothetical protein
LSSLYCGSCFFHRREEFGIGKFGTHSESNNGGGFLLKKAGPRRVYGPIHSGSVIRRKECVTNHPRGAGNRILQCVSMQEAMPYNKKKANVGMMSRVSLKATIIM